MYNYLKLYNDYEQKDIINDVVDHLMFNTCSSTNVLLSRQLRDKEDLNPK